MVIFHSYVSLPEGKPDESENLGMGLPDSSGFPAGTEQQVLLPGIRKHSPQKKNGNSPS